AAGAALTGAGSAIRPNTATKAMTAARMSASAGLENGRRDYMVSSAFATRALVHLPSILSAARDSGGVDRRIARLNPDIDDRDTTRIDTVDRGPQGAWQLVGPAHRTKALAALRLCQHPEIGL